MVKEESDIGRDKERIIKHFEQYEIREIKERIYGIKFIVIKGDGPFKVSENDIPNGWKIERVSITGDMVNVSLGIVVE